MQNFSTLFYPSSVALVNAKDIASNININIVNGVEITDLSAKALDAYDIALVYQSVSSTYLTAIPANLSLTSVNATVILSGGVNLFDIFLTSETDSQTLSYVPSSYNLSISNGNSVNLSSIVISSNSNAVFQTVSAIALSGIFYGDGSNLIGASLPGQQQINTTVQTNSAGWNTAYNTATAYSSISSSFATNSAVNGVSSLLTPLTLTNTLTSQLITNTAFTNYQTSVAGSTATLLPTSIYQNASGNWQQAYTNLVTNSAAYLSSVDLTFLQEPSANWNSTYTTVQANSSNWQDTYTAVQQGSSNWYSASGEAFNASKGYSHQNFVPLSGNAIIQDSLTIAGSLNVLSSVYIAGSAFYVNAQDLVVTDPIIYIAEDNQTDLLDIGFMASWTNAPGFPTGYQHGGLVRRAGSDTSAPGVWTLFSGASSEPLSALNVEWNQPGIILEPLSAKFYGDIYGNRNVYGLLSATGPIYGSNLNIANWDSAYTTVQSNSANYILQGGNTVTVPLSVGTTSTQPLILETNNTNRITILSSGQVGIGTSNPNSALTVVGNISASDNLSATNITGKRFIFSDSFQESFIWNNGIGITAGGPDAYKIHIHRLQGILTFAPIVIGGSGSTSFIDDSTNYGATNIGVIAQRNTFNGLQPQTFRLYNHYTNSTNYQRGTFTLQNSALVLGTEYTTTAGNSALSSQSMPIILAPGYNQSLSATSPVVLQQTWNNANNTFTLLSANVTDTASSNVSRLIDLQINGSTKFAILKDANTGTDAVLRMSSGGGGSATFSVGDTNIFRAYGSSFGAQPLYIQAGSGITFVPNNNANANATLLTEGPPFGVLALRRDTGLDPQEFRIYNTYTNAGNYERGNLRWSSSTPTPGLSVANTFVVGTSGDGTGRGRTLQLTPGNNIVEQVNGLSAQTFRIYNTYTTNPSVSASTSIAAVSSEFGYTGWSGNTFQIGTSATGSGTNRSIEFQTAGTTQMTIGSAGTIALRDNNSMVFSTSPTRFTTLSTNSMGGLAMTLTSNGSNIDSNYGIIVAGGPLRITGANGFGQSLVTSGNLVTNSIFAGAIGATNNGSVGWTFGWNGVDGIVATGNSTTAVNLTVPIVRIGGTTAAFPALKNSLSGIQIRRADDSDFAPLSASVITAVSGINITGNLSVVNVIASGDITANRIQATVKNFYIDHPTKPGKHLVYSSLESPYNGVQLTGEGEVVNGQCVVVLPDYISGLIHPNNVHIQLTNHKHSKTLYVDSIEVDKNRFTVKCDSWTSKFKTLKFFWLLNGVRRDIEELQTEV